MVSRYTNAQLENYASSLARVGSLSNLFSESQIPFIHYRATEYLYARTLDAKNLARSDIAIDAKRGSVGVGIKTFVYYGKPKYEKIAEFNKEIGSFRGLDPAQMIKRVAELRNERIDFAGRLTGVDSFRYHCIARLPGKLFVFEEEMPRINIDSIKIVAIRGGNVSFTDGSSNYRFNTSKSTLFKEFYSDKALFEKPVIIHDDPYSLIASMALDERPVVLSAQVQVSDDRDRIVLPLYGITAGLPHVFEGSGLNQWNAKGRRRNLGEVYIPIPASVRKISPDFLPLRDKHFELYLPSGDHMTVKVCQDDGKALMSKRNADLGEWILRDSFGLREGELLTIEKLRALGVDSVEISKDSKNGRYHIDFKKTGSFEEYLESAPN